MACGETCRRVRGRAAHCGACHETFSGVTAFDRHRVRGACVDPVTRGMHRNERGTWRSDGVHPLSRHRVATQG